jgi:predicted RNA-binding protein with PUA-like domain
MNYWIFKCNPHKYRIEERLKNPEKKITWLVTRYRDQINVGDIAFVWRTEKDRGIVGAMRITKKPFWRKELESELTYCIDLDNSMQVRVVAELISRGPFISQKQIKAIPELQDLSIFQGFKQATNHKITKEKGETLRGIWALN